MWKTLKTKKKKLEKVKNEYGKVENNLYENCYLELLVVLNVANLLIKALVYEKWVLH